MLLLTPVFCAALNWSIDRVVYKPLRRAPKLAPLVSAIGVSFCLMNLGMFWNGVMPEKSIREGEVRYDKVPSASGRNFPALLATPAAVRNLQEWGVSDERGNVLDGRIARSVFGDAGGLRFTVSDLLIVLVTVPLMIGLTLFVKRSSLGKAMRATAQNPTAAQLMGINVDRVIGLTFIIGGALAGFGSVVAALTLYNTIDYQLGYQQGLYAFTAAVLGGIGNIPGAVLGALVIGLVQSFGSVLIGEKWTSAMVFVILIVMLVFRPTGLLGSRTREKV
jgi:branched-chain amino acid transport system permease protein